MTGLEPPFPEPPDEGPGLLVALALIAIGWALGFGAAWLIL